MLWDSLVEDRSKFITLTLPLTCTSIITPMEEHAILDKETVLGRLSSEKRCGAEDQRPWQVLHFPVFRGPLLRIWDQHSGSQPGKCGRLISRDPHTVLDTHHARRTSLSRHLRHSDPTPGPYISFTSSPAEIEALARMRSKRGRGPQVLTLIDPNRRASYGLPTLAVVPEMKHFRIPTPYGEAEVFYKNHYVCLWQVTKPEIVGHWDWNELKKTDDWYYEIIKPAFARFTAAYASTSSFLGQAKVVNEMSWNMDGQLCKIT